MLEKVKRTSLTETIMRQIIDYVNRDLKPGDRLPSERDLMTVLGVGRSSLREAIRALEVIGIVETRSGEGTFVTMDESQIFNKPLEWGTFSKQVSINQLYEARRTIEIAIIPLIISKITDKQINELKSTFTLMENAAEDKDIQRFLDADYRLHRLLSEYTQNTLLQDVIHLTYRIFQKERGDTAPIFEKFNEIMERHREVVEAIAARDTERSIRAMVAHMDITKSLLSI